MKPNLPGGFLRSASLPVVTACALSACSLNLGCGFEPARHRETRTSQTAHLPGTTLKVRTANGMISVRRGTGREVILRAYLRATTQERLDAVRILAEREADGTLAIGAEWPAPGRRGSEGCGFEVILPEGTRVDLKTSNGKISLGGMEGPARVETSNGKILVGTHQGPARLRTSNGSVTVERIDGPLDAHTSNGSITVVRAEAAVDLGTSNGSVSFTGGPAFTGDLKVSTSNGSIRTGECTRVQLVSKKKRSAHLRVGAGGGQSRIRTSNGSVTIKIEG